MNLGPGRAAHVSFGRTFPRMFSLPRYSAGIFPRKVPTLTSHDSIETIGLPAPPIGAGVRVPTGTRVIARLVAETSGAAVPHRLTVLSAPAGYGKTATVAAWLGEGDDPGGSVRWVRGERAAPDALWRSLMQEMAPFSRSAATLGVDPVRAAMRTAAGIVTGLTLVVDDYHQSTGVENDTAIAELSVASPQLRIVVIGRRTALLDGPLVSAKTRVLRVRSADLALTPEDVGELVAALGVPPSDRLNAALEHSDGWPLAVGAVLSLGSDDLYLDTPAGRFWADAPVAPAFDPLANLAAFAENALEGIGPEARRVMAAATLVEAISLSQIARMLGDGAAPATVGQLVDVGLLVPASAAEYRCHPAVRAFLQAVAVPTLGVDERGRIRRDRAAEIEQDAPFSAFVLYCDVGDYASAEAVLARNFATIIDEVGVGIRVLREVPDDALLAHPTLAFALLFLELPQTDVAAERIDHLVRLWARGLQQRLPQGAETAPGPLHFPLLCQAMAAARFSDGSDESHALMRQIESRFSLSQLDGVSGFLPVYDHLAASTALAASDLEGARRNLDRLRVRSERMGSDAGVRWLLAALSGSAFADLLDGELYRCAETLAEFDELVERTGLAAPSVSWVGAEIARAHLSYETGDRAMFERAATALGSLGRRLEHWPLLLIAECAWMRHTRTTCAVLTQLRSGLAEPSEGRPADDGWSGYLPGFEIMLCSVLGDLPTAAELLESAPADSTQLQLERARFALFSGDDVRAMLTAQRTGAASMTKRQQIERLLISAVAAWSAARRDDAFVLLHEAADLLERCGVASALQNVPYRLLRELVIAAREAGVCDLVDAVDGVPEPARAKRYERLTEMELRTLQTIAQHRSASGAAAELFVTEGTVKKHLASVYRKLNANGRDEAILQASRMGFPE